MNIKRQFIIRGSILLGLTFILIWLMFGPLILTRAASYTVCHTGPPMCDYSSIQSAVDAAGDGDVIKVATGTYTGINNKGGQAQVVYIDKSITIRGGYTTSNWTTSDPLANPTTIDAQEGGRVLYITGNISPTIMGLRITNGLAPNIGSGGGVRVDISSATLEGMTILENVGNGVLISNSPAKLVNNTIISNNRGVFLWESDNALVIGNTISNNNNSGTGGGLWSNGDNVIISGNAISNNSAEWFGGVDIKGNNVRVIGNIISFNAAVNVGGGGTIGEHVEFIGNKVISNTAGEIGGGLYIGEGEPTITGNTFSDNSAIDGTAITLSAGNPILTNNLIVNNQSHTSGSAIYIQDEVTDSRLVHNTITRNNGSNGRGISIYGASVDMTNNIIVEQAVGIYVHNDASASLNTTLWGSGTWANGMDWAGTGTINTTNNLWGNPDFVDPNAGDYHIGPNSDAIDQGVDAGVKNDIDFHPRPYQEPDIGADEYWPPGALKFIYLPIITR